MFAVTVIVEGEERQWPATMKRDPALNLLDDIPLMHPVPDEMRGYDLLELVDGRWIAVKRAFEKA